MTKIIKSLIILLMAAALLVLLYFLFGFSNSFPIDMASKTKMPASQEGTSGQSNPGNKDKVVLAAVGDIMLSRDVEQRMIARKDWKYPFLETSSLTSGADLAFGNLETPVVAGDAVSEGSFVFRTDPKAVEGLRFAGFDVLSLANNHMMNFGKDGLQSTLQNLDAAGVGHIGAGIGEDEISRPVVREVKGVRIGFLAYSYLKEQVADKNGTYGVAYMDAEKMKKQVADLRKDADVVVVSMHAGTEYATFPNRAQTDFARAAINAGADLVIGHHPHTVQTFEKYNGGYIIYSLGNFVFDQMWSEETRLGAVAEIVIENKKISKIDFVPIKIFDYAQPKLAEGKDKNAVLDRLKMQEN